MLHFALLLPLLSTPAEFPGQCESLTSVPSKEGPRLQRVRRPVPRAEVVKTIRAVAAEMGADPQLLLAIASHESTMEPAALHILPGDRGAGLSAWRAGTPVPARMERYQKIVDQGPEHPNFYKAKFGLWRMGRYQDNAYWYSTTKVGDETINTWTWGYGLYGMAPVLFVGIWDSKSPPWILCDPKVATVALVWALRGQRAECAAQGEKGTVEQTIARFASGWCGRKMRKDWRKVLGRTTKVVLGNKWKRGETDRAALLQAIDRRLQLLEG